jgi:aryl-alcohol dehydrogenase-like predicted oxidoreductase
MCFGHCLPFHTSAILGPRTMQQLDDLLAGADVALSDVIVQWGAAKEFSSLKLTNG